MAGKLLYYRLYAVLVRLLPCSSLYFNPSIRWKTRRHSEMNMRYLLPHFEKEYQLESTILNQYKYPTILSQSSSYL